MEKVFRVFPDGNIKTVYFDGLTDMNFGKMECPRASDVRFDPDTQKWEIVFPDGMVLPGFKNRQDAIRKEVEILNNQLAS